MRLGTRGSPLAIIQTQELRDRLLAAHPGLDVEIVTVKTTGDRVQDRKLDEIGGKGLFTREIEAQLDDGRLHVAVHSMKDVPTFLPGRYTLPCVLPRADVRDVLVSRESATLTSLPAGARVGTASLRRQAQVLSRRPDLEVTLFRGNVNTRLRKLNEGVADATILARCGLDRLGMQDLGTTLSPEEMLPSVGQGAIGGEIRADDEATRALLAAVNDADTETEMVCERALLAALDGSCRTPIAGLAQLEDGTIWLRGLVVSPDGKKEWRTERRGPRSDAERMGRDAGEELRGRADPAIFEGPR